MKAIRQNAEVAVRGYLKKVHKERNGKPLQAIDYMDDGTVSVNFRAFGRTLLTMIAVSAYRLEYLNQS
jgi:hypothetical protein